jgi:A/G-specific adenine glycosylase
MTVASFRKIVWNHYKKFGRHNLPWRKTRDLYKILVSEVMLQQTQVERVIPFYEKFLKRFPTAQKLAAAPLSEVLKSWQGLGYNRRAKQLRAAAQAMVGRKKFSVVELEALPGIGPYTARAVAAFAYNEDDILLETNIRTAITHHFFAGKKKVSDTEIEKILIPALPKGKAREWYFALMDYGAFLKKSGIKLNAKRPQYVKQTRFAGSIREARGAILRTLAEKSQQGETLLNLFGASRRSQIRTALLALRTENLIAKTGEKYSLAD